ncbi:MAG: cyclic nucleotide-binding domain-containing protein [Chloroflexota bacterium]
MLTPIEKVLTLKQVSLFHDMSINQLRILASISEELSFEVGDVIVKQGEYTDALFVIVQGKVEIRHYRQRQNQRRQRTRTEDAMQVIAQLEPSEYFGELSIFDGEPFANEVVALDKTDILIIHQQALHTLVAAQPTLAITLVLALSQRLRTQMNILDETVQAKAKVIVDIFDQLENK